MSYAGFLALADVVLVAVVWVFVLRHNITTPGGNGELLRSFGPVALVVLVFLLVFGFVGGWLLAGRMLAPLTQITAATRTAAKGSLTHRVRLPGRNDEFRELADTFDLMLARLEAHVGEQRRFAANASHELRTPLAITQSLLDVADRDPGRDPKVLVDRLRVVNTRAIELTEALLLLSRTDQLALEREEVDLSLVAEEAAETLLPLAHGRRVTVEVVGDVGATRGSPPLLLQLVSNLVHNAIVHNLPAGGVVWVATSVVDAGWVTLTVENTGERLDPRIVPTLTEPFQRGTGRVRTDHAGVGLGLAIVRRVTEVHGGLLTLVARPGGGLRATVALPAATPRRDPSTTPRARGLFTATTQATGTSKYVLGQGSSRSV